MNNQEYFFEKTAVITGAASGIGLALAEELLKRGVAKIVIADYNKDNLDKHTERLNAQYPGKVKGILCDVTDENQVKSMVNEAAEFFSGRLDIVINNAGKGFSGQFAEHFDSKELEKIGFLPQSNKEWKQAFALNFYGALYGCRAAIPIMLKQESGQIINIISGIALCAMPFQTMYSATKSALLGLTLSLRSEYSDENILFSAATPGTTATAIWEGAGIPASAQTPEASAQRILEGVIRNDRLILGDDGDASSAEHAFHPDAAEIYDKYTLNIARERRKGHHIV